MKQFQRRSCLYVLSEVEEKRENVKIILEEVRKTKLGKTR